MKKLILSLAICSSCYFAKAQVNPRSDTSALLRKPNAYGTDSVRNGNELYEGGKGNKSKSMGDTLSGSKQGHKSSSHQGNKSGMKQDHTSPNAAPTSTTGMPKNR